MPRPFALVPLVAVPALLLSACGSSSLQQPKATAFSPGVCRSLAPSVLELGRDLSAIKGKTSVPDAVATSLQTAQAKVILLKPAADPVLMPTIENLVVGVGIVRLQNDTNSFQASFARSAFSSYTKVLTACVPSSKKS